MKSLKYDYAAPHTIKKFELIDKYVEVWLQKLINFGCEKIMFIDCMSNCGVYIDSSGQIIEGTAIRVVKSICRAMEKYPNNTAYLFFNDLDEDKCNELRRRIPVHGENVKICVTCLDRDEFLNKLTQTKEFHDSHTLLIYDPYDAHLNWNVLSKFINKWGEVIINHMVSDPIRGVKVAKRENTIAKYEETYQLAIEELYKFGTDRKKYEHQVENIIKEVNSREKIWIATFPFFLPNNALIYDLIFITHSSVGFNEFKKAAWKTFGDKSSIKKGKDINQQSLDLHFQADEIVPEDECLCILDMVDYINAINRGKSCVIWDSVFDPLKNHPIFPDAYRKEILAGLKNKYKVIRYKDKTSGIYVADFPE